MQSISSISFVSFSFILLSILSTVYAYYEYHPMYDYISLNTTVRSEPFYIESTTETPTYILQKKVALNITGTATIINNTVFSLDIDIGSLKATNFSLTGDGSYMGYQNYKSRCFTETPFVNTNGSGLYALDECSFYHKNRFSLYAHIPDVGERKIASMFFYCSTGNCIDQWSSDFPGVPVPVLPIRPSPPSPSPSPSATVEIPQDPQDPQNRGLNAGQIIGIVMGVIAVVILVVGFVALRLIDGVEDEGEKNKYVEENKSLDAELLRTVQVV